MSIQEFSKTLQSEIYKKWLNSLDKDIIKNSAKSLRDSQQVAAKTDFYVNRETIKNMYKSVTGLDIPSEELDVFIQDLIRPQGTGKNKVEGVPVLINGTKVYLFKSIGFDTITSRLTKIFDADVKVQDAYQQAEETYLASKKEEIAAIKSNKSLKASEKQDEISKIEAEAKRRGTFGTYFNKGHVIGIATNLTKKFRDELDKADALSKKERDNLILVLDQYIAKLEQEDLASANLPDAISQELYAGYIKSSDKYLVEIQCAIKNQGSGATAAKPVLEELRNLFGIDATDISDIINKSPTLGKKLLETEGSPSYINLLVKDLVDVLNTGTTKASKVYKESPVLIGKQLIPINKPKSNKSKIQKLKNLKAKTKAVKSDPNRIATRKDIVTTNLVQLQNLINQNLAKQIQSNMGTGNSTKVLNYRTGRFAESAKVEKMSESRQGMITAFYSYMRNPYGTFAEGGAQEFPVSRNPKLLIAQSIRQLAGAQVANRMRAVLV